MPPRHRASSAKRHNRRNTPGAEKNTAAATPQAQAPAQEATTPAPPNPAPATQDAPRPPRSTPAERDDLYFPQERRSLLPNIVFQSALLPYRVVERNWRHETPHMVAVFFAVLLLYALTTPRLVTLEDDGLFIANMKFFGVAHPPGYPLHTFLGGIFYHILPFGSPAFRGHFFSGFAGAIACAAIYACVIMLVRGRLFGYLGGLAYGASKTFWSQAIIAEVYTLNSALFFVVLALCIYYASHTGRGGPKHQRLLYITAFVYGLGVANHYPLLFLGSTGLGLLVFSQLLKNILPNILKASVMLALGAVPPYLWMVWRSFDLTPANFYGPIENFDQFLFYVRRSGYSGVDTQEGVGWDDKLIFAEHLGNDMLWQFTPLGCVFVVLGAFMMLRTRFNWLCVSLLVSWFTSSVLLIFLLDFQASFIWIAAFRVYHLLAFGIMAIWLALGAAWAVDALRRTSFNVRQSVAGGLVAAVVGGSVFAHWEINNRKNYHWAHDLAMAKINSVEPNAVLFTFDDLDLPLGYLHYVEGVRPDLTVYNDQGLVYGNRLYSPLIPDAAPKHSPNIANKSILLRQFIDQTPRPIYYHPQRRELYKHPRYGSDFMGFLRRVNRDGPQERVILSDQVRAWLSDNAAAGDTITDLWTQQQHFSTVSQLTNIVIIAYLNGFPLDDKWWEVLDRVRERSAEARLLINWQMLAHNRFSKEEMERELEWTRTYDIDAQDLVADHNKSGFFTLRADLVQRLSPDGRDDPEYLESLLSGMRRMENKNNPALGMLMHFYNEKEQYCDLLALADRYYQDVENIPTDLLRRIRQARQKAGNCLPATDAG